VLEHAGAGGDGTVLTVVVPTNRPDVRPEPYGVDDVIEEIARTFGYSNVPRHVPTWPQPGHLNELQRSRRVLKDVMLGLGASEGWTDTFVSAAAHVDVGLTGEAVRVSNPLDAEKPYLRRSLLPGLLSALSYNAGRRQGDIRLFEDGVVFSHPSEGRPRIVERAGAGGAETAELPGERELVSVVFAGDEDDARSAVAAWHVIAEAFRLDGVRFVPPGGDAPPLPGLHPTRSAHLVAQRESGGTVTIGSVGEVDPGVASTFGLTMTAGGATSARRIGWLEVDLGLLFDEKQVRRRLTVGGAVSRFPSSDIDLALVVDDGHPADAVADALRTAAGDLLEAVHLFDVYRGAGIAEGSRSLAYRLRFCAPDRTLTDEEVGQLRAACIAAVEKDFGAVLR
jgi:phenylalanyl-tRNA synthetase beta chain